MNLGRIPYENFFGMQRENRKVFRLEMKQIGIKGIPERE